MEIASLHRDERRHEYFAENLDSPVSFDIGCQAFVVLDPAQADAIFRQPGVCAGTGGAAVAYENLQRQFGRSFPNILFALKQLPLANEGETHRAQRKRMAAFLRDRRAAAAADVEATVLRLVGALDRAGEIDVVEELLSPLVSATVRAYTGVTVADEVDVSGSTMIFDRMIGFGKRRRLEETVGQIRASIRRSLGEDIADEDEGMILALHILGQDTLIGTVGESLYRLFKASSGLRLCAIDYPAIPNETGVSVIERTVVDPFIHAGRTFDTNDRLRIQMQCFAYSPDPVDKPKIFGVGPHACLGRQMSLDLWGALVGRLSRIERRVEILEYSARGSDYVFTVPEKFRIGLVQ